MHIDNITSHFNMKIARQIPKKINKSINGRVCMSNYIHVLYLIKNLLGASCKTYLEIGTLHGGSMLIAMQSGLASTFVGIDPFEDHGYYGKPIDPHSGVRVTLANTQANINRNNPHKHPFKLIKGFSTDPEVIAKVKEEFPVVDFLFIDGDHSTEGVTKDFNNYSSLVRPGGILVFDNYQDPAYKGRIAAAIRKIDRTDWITVGQYGYSLILERKKELTSLSEFEPYTTSLDIKGIDAKFFIATAQAKKWYDPLKLYATVEFEWVLQNISLENQTIVDGGAHHGAYSVLFALGSNKSCKLVAVDPYPSNCELIEKNLSLNGATARIEQCAIHNKNAMVHFMDRSNGQITEKGGILVAAHTLRQLAPDAEIVKLDIEGAEYWVIPETIDALNRAHTWIIEIHPAGRVHPDKLIKLFLKRGYEIMYVNHAKNCVEPCRLSMPWKSHSTIFARRKIQ